MLALTLRRFENGDGFGNHEANLFNLRDIDKFQEFKKHGPTFVYVLVSLINSGVR